MLALRTFLKKYEGFFAGAQSRKAPCALVDETLYQSFAELAVF